jgi:uncharacterized Tic20 family protein
MDQNLTPQTTQAPPSSSLSTQEKNWAMFAHLSTFLGWIGIPLANLLAPLIIWQIKKDTMPFAAEQAKEALNFQITLTIFAVISAILMFVFIGIIGLFALLVIDIIFTIMASIKANDGVSYRYPMTIRFVK